MSEHSYLVPDLKEKESIQYFIIKYDLVVGFLFLALIRLRKCPSFPSFFNVFIMKGIEFY